MRVGWHAFVLVIAAASIANACAAIAGLSDPSDPPADVSPDAANIDATITEATTTIDATGGDVASDAGFDADDGRCRLLADDSFDDDASLGRWRFLGQARLSNGEAQLVPSQEGVAGAIWKEVPDAGTGVLHATFKSNITQGGAPGDGLTFVWTSTATPSLGGTGGNLGLCDSNVNGLAVFVSSLESELRFLNVANGSCNELQGYPVNPFSTKNVDLTARTSNVAIRFGSGLMVNTSSPKNVTIRAIGFTAATGGAWARHAVDDVRVEICNE